MGHLSATTTTRASRLLLAAALTSASLAVTLPAGAQEGDGDDEPGVTCDAELLEDEDLVDEDELDGPLYLFEAGTVTCTATGLDPELAADYEVGIFGFTLADLFGDEEPEPTVVAPDEPIVLDPDQTSLDFSFTLADDLLVAEVEGVVWQEDGDDTPYEEWFHGVLIADLEEGDLVCAPEPVEQGAQLTCEGEDFEAGEFGYEAYVLTLDELLGLVTDGADADLEPFEDGVGTVDDDGVAAFTVTIPAAGSPDIYITVAEQGTRFATGAGEVVPAAVADDGEEPQEDDTPEPVTPPTRVDAGAGGASGSSSAAFGLAAVALLGVLALRRRATARA